MSSSEEQPTLIALGRYVAHVLPGNHPKPFWYYMIQRRDSVEVVELEKYETYSQAVEAAQEVLGRMSRETL